MTPTFSIIIPVYNVAPYLRECMDSILAQTYTDWEAICVDDGSTDGSGAILDEYVEKVEKLGGGGQRSLKVIHQPNRGVSAARNAALDVAGGEWIMFVDGDDVLEPNTFAGIYKCEKEYPNEKLIRFGYANFKDGASLTSIDAECQINSRVVDISYGIAYEDYFVYAVQYAYKRNLIDDVRFPLYARGEDRVFLIRILCEKVASFVALDAIYYFYRQRQGSAVHQRPSVQVLKDELSHRVDMIEAMDKSGKKIEYGGYWGLEGYCAQQYQQIVYGWKTQYGAIGTDPEYEPYTDSELNELVDWFYHELPRIRKSRGFVWYAKIACCMYRFCRGRIWWRFVSTIWPIFAERTQIVFCDPARVLRAIGRRIHKSSKNSAAANT